MLYVLWVGIGAVNQLMLVSCRSSWIKHACTLLASHQRWHLLCSHVKWLLLSQKSLWLSQSYSKAERHSRVVTVIAVFPSLYFKESWVHPSSVAVGCFHGDIFKGILAIRQNMMWVIGSEPLLVHQKYQVACQHCHSKEQGSGRS